MRVSTMATSQVHRFTIPAQVRMLWGRDVFDDTQASALRTIFKADQPDAKVLAVIDANLAAAQSRWIEQLRRWFDTATDDVASLAAMHEIPGGEVCKNDEQIWRALINLMDRVQLDRQSYLLCVGGGAVLDATSFAGAIFHRGVRVVRIPGTTLSQCDSGVGVKAAVNALGKKNLVGSFHVPAAVIHDASLLTSLDQQRWIEGFSEIVKVALIKDAALFEAMEAEANAIVARDLNRAMPLIQRSAELHLEHITRGGDPFEQTTARPLDFGHWAAHHLEQLSQYTLSHGQAVAIGLAIDIQYAMLSGMLDAAVAERAIALLRNLGFELHHQLLHEPQALLGGLEAFREHLGGELTLTLATDIGEACEVHHVDMPTMKKAIRSFAG